jgi:hypothetical protein
MTKETRPGEIYGKRVAAAFSGVSIYERPEVFLGQFNQLERVVGNLLAAHWCQSEVCNGGFHQFFGNSTGVLAPEALRAFEDMGLKEWAMLLRQAMEYFGAEYPRSRETRQCLLPPHADGERADWDPFRELDEEFFRWFHGDDDRWYKAADAYAVRTDA